jgi:hypothetical protein
MPHSSLRLAAAVVTLSLVSGCGHLGRGLGSVAGKIAVNGDHRLRHGTAEERAAIAEQRRLEAAERFERAEAAYTATATPVPTF